VNQSITSVCLCTRNPRPALLESCLDALRRQETGSRRRELWIIDNGSEPAIPVPTGFPAGWAVRVIREMKEGLMHARLTALAACTGEVLVFVDDDNFLRPGYLLEAERLMEAERDIGAAGGKLLGKPESRPPEWFDAVAGDLLVRDHGGTSMDFVDNTPCGGGLVLRTEAFREIAGLPFLLVGRQGKTLLAGEDTEMCLRLRARGWRLHYSPDLVLDHFLETRRLNLPYLLRMNRGFGMARPILSLYTESAPAWRRVHYLRRCRGERKRARILEGQACAVEEETVEGVGLRLDAAFAQGMADGYWRLAKGPAVWRDVEREFGCGRTGR